MKDNTINVAANSYNVNDIKKIELVETIDHRIKGTGTLTSLRGVCKLEGENKDANVYIYKNKSPYIIIDFKDEKLIYNDKTNNETEKTYKNLCELTSN